MGDFQCRVAPSCQAVAPGKRGSTGPGVFPPGRGGGSGWSAGRQGLGAGHRGGYLAGPGTVLGEPQPEVAAAPDESSGDGEQAQAEPSGFRRRAVPVRASSWLQASSSQAIATISRHTGSGRSQHRDRLLRALLSTWKCLRLGTDRTSTSPVLPAQGTFSLRIVSVANTQTKA